MSKNDPGSGPPATVRGVSPEGAIRSSRPLSRWSTRQSLSDEHAIARPPYLDCAYKLQEYAGEPRRKRSSGKATWPGRKQVHRFRDARGQLALISDRLRALARRLDAQLSGR